MDRKSNVSRTTSETDIQIEMNLDGKGKYNISTGVNFLIICWRHFQNIQ